MTESPTPPAAEAGGEGAPKRGRGRPRRLEQEPKLTGLICRRLRLGDPPEVACERYCVTRRSYDNWLAKGEADVEKGLETAEADFFLRVKRAIAIFFGDALANVRAGGIGWQSEAWALERRGREHFARPTALEVSGPGGKPVQIDAKHHVDVSKLPLDELERLVRGGPSPSGAG